MNYASIWKTNVVRSEKEENQSENMEQKSHYFFNIPILRIPNGLKNKTFQFAIQHKCKKWNSAVFTSKA